MTTRTNETFEVLAREFPDFDQATLPLIPEGFEDISHGIEGCPSFHNTALGLVLWVDFSNEADRENEGLKRFSIYPCDETGAHTTDLAAVDTDDWAEAQAFILAHQFAAELREQLTEEEFAQMRIDNVGVAEGICASHDFCDANMPMDDAFEKVMGHRLPLGEETPEPYEAFATGAAIWNAAWKIATPTLLTATAEEVLCDEFKEFCEIHDIANDAGDAMDLLMSDTLTDDQRHWLTDFSERWDEMRAAEDQAHTAATVVSPTVSNA